jgi:hypothetical protein
MVFGLNHSGTLVLANLSKLCSRVYGVYKGEKPFIFARDDEYDGIKQESAIIADSILAGSQSNCTLLSLTKDGSAVDRIIKYCDYVIYCVGFKQRGMIIKKDDTLIALSDYDAKNARLSPNSEIWCYGAGFPNSTDYKGKIYYDVGIPSFIDYMLRTFPSF